MSFPSTLTKRLDSAHMLTSVRLQNFRSIRQADVRLAPMGLTVVVGANGAGKSNFVRALEFVAGLHTDGLPAAIGKQGGMYSILPKVIPISQLYRQTTTITYEIDL